jgi:hypothetical protein
MGTILLIMGLVVALIGAFGIIFEAFSVGVLWGLACLVLQPVGPALFVFLHWRSTRKPFLIYVLGNALIAAGVFLKPD